ncbi:MAG: TerB family tellurite resistance protein [Rhodospirillales bacterium]|jgi:tellurite resistance protein TerB|nr:TerB family tellurite resistance protein [Rhodospirillales bacterium]
MPNRTTRDRWGMTRTEIAAAYADDREDELLEAVVTAAALVARSDGHVTPVERGELLDFLDRNDFLSVFTRRDILDVFDRRLRHVDENGREVAIAALRRLAGRLPANLIIAAAERVAAADRHIHARERDVLALIRTAVSPS